MIAILYFAIALGLAAIVTLTVGACIAIGDMRYERLQSRIDVEVIAFAASIPDDLSEVQP